MNKNVWTRPLTMVQRFEANEYVAACGEGGATYKFKCDAPAGTLYYYPYSDGKIDGVYEGWGSAERMGGYTPCGVTHDAPDTGDFYDGFIDRNGNRRPDAGEGVIVWRNREWVILGWRWNGHATTNLDMDSWGKTPS